MKIVEVVEEKPYRVGLVANPHAVVTEVKQVVHVWDIDYDASSQVRVKYLDKRGVTVETYPFVQYTESVFDYKPLYEKSFLQTIRDFVWLAAFLFVIKPISRFLQRVSRWVHLKWYQMRISSVPDGSYIVVSAEEAKEGITPPHWAVAYRVILGVASLGNEHDLTNAFSRQTKIYPRTMLNIADHVQSPPKFRLSADRTIRFKEDNKLNVMFVFYSANGVPNDWPNAPSIRAAFGKARHHNYDVDSPWMNWQRDRLMYESSTIEESESSLGRADDLSKAVATTQDPDEW